MGDRSPGIWFYSDTTKMHIRTGASGGSEFDTGAGGIYNNSGNNGLNPT